MISSHPSQTLILKRSSILTIDHSWLIEEVQEFPSTDGNWFKMNSDFLFVGSISNGFTCTHEAVWKSAQEELIVPDEHGGSVSKADRNFGPIGSNPAC